MPQDHKEKLISLLIKDSSINNIELSKSVGINRNSLSKLKLSLEENYNIEYTVKTNYFDISYFEQVY